MPKVLTRLWCFWIKTSISPCEFDHHYSLAYSAEQTWCHGWGAPTSQCSLYRAWKALRCSSRTPSGRSLSCTSMSAKTGNGLEVSATEKHISDANLKSVTSRIKVLVRLKKTEDGAQVLLTQELLILLQLSWNVTQGCCLLLSQASGCPIGNPLVLLHWFYSNRLSSRHSQIKTPAWL